MLLAVQLDTVWNNKLASWKRAEFLIRQTIVPPGSLIVFPEMFATGYMMDVSQACEQEASASEHFMSGLAYASGGFVLGGVVNRADEGRGRNEAVVFGPDGVERARYQKIRPFSYAGETEYYEPGHKLVLFDWNGFKVAPFICYDLRFPELFRYSARLGAQLFVVIANWPASRVSHWVTLLQARAIENQAYVVGVNRCGSDPNLSYPGRSLIIDPRGEIMADAGAGPSVISASPDLGALIRYREEFPALKDAGWE